MTEPSPVFAPYSGLNYRSAKRFLAEQFREADLPFADEDALELVLGLSGLDHAGYIAKGTEFVATDLLSQLRNAAARRLGGEPIDRILGWRDFYGRRFTIDNVLSPRGDTEVLLLAALKAFSNYDTPRALELGTGSGALAITLLSECEDATLLATDIDPAALATATANAKTHGVTKRITLQQSDWFANIEETGFDAILSNPPYITDAAMQALPKDVAEFDPDCALRGGNDGLDAYEIIIPDALNHLR
ncbi:MAG: HemK/PrmC family methyltransferase, partial [Pseudomonadota bacterium]